MEKKKKKQRTYKFGTSEVAFLVVTTCILSFIMAMLIFDRNKNYVEVAQDEHIKKIIEQYNNIVNNYYGDIDKKTLTDEAIRGMINSLGDPYASYFSGTDAENFNIKLNGEYTGVGLEIIKLEDNKTYVVNVFEGSNAYEKGVRVDDIILSINGINMEDLTTEQFANIVKKDGRANVLFQRNDETFEVELTASHIDIKSVHSSLETRNGQKIGYIKMDIFALNTYDQFNEALTSLESQDMNSLIIDLRDNTGGHLTTVHNILSLFLNRDKIIYQIKKQNSLEKYYSDGNKNKNYKIVIIVNNNSASASELMAASLNEQLDATIIGMTTFGKGTAQELIKLSTGEEYKFTTKEWLTPKGNSINNKGVVPSIECDGDACLDKAYEILG